MMEITKAELDPYGKGHKKGASLWNRKLSLPSAVSMEAVELK